MPKRNYNQAKRQRELSRDEKKAQKLQRRLERTPPPPEGDGPDAESPDLPPSSTDRA
jgi:hypothetical protein